MSDWLNRLLGKNPNSANQAKERLKLVLIHDRTDLSAATLETLKDELIAVLSKYIPIDPQAVKIEVNQEGREQRLIADIPIKPARSRSK